MEKSAVAELSKPVFASMIDKFVSYAVTQKDSIAPLLTGMLSALYFTYFPSQEALLFSALSFTGLALISQFTKFGFWITCALQAVFFSYIVFLEGALAVDQTFFSVQERAERLISR